MELLTGLAVGWQQRLHSVKVPQTKGGAPRLHRIPVKPSLWRLPEEPENYIEVKFIHKDHILAFGL